LYSGDYDGRDKDDIIRESYLAKALAYLEKQGEQKPVEWSEEDERMYRGLHNLIYSTPYCDSRKKFSDFLDSFKNRLQLNLKHEWSEEDDNMIMSINHHLDSQKNYVTNTTNIEQCQNWLKSFKDRVQPQLKQEWSEDDEKMLNEIIEDVIPCGECPDYPTEEERKYYYEGQKKVDWLKSLKPQKQWKPSEEQIKAVEESLSLAKNCGEEYSFDLRTLLEQLKAL